MARWLNWLERPVHTREVESSSLSLATTKTSEISEVFLFYETSPSLLTQEQSELDILGIESLILDFMPNENFCVGKDMEIFLSFARFLLRKGGDYLRFEEISAKSFS